MNLPDVDLTSLTKEDKELEDKVLKLIHEHLNCKFEDLDENLKDLAIKLAISSVIPNIVNRVLRGEG